MSETEPSLLSVRELPEGTSGDTGLATVELHQTDEDTQQLLSDEEQAAEDNVDSSVRQDWSIQSKLHQRKASWWCLEPEVRENYRVVITAWVIVTLGLGCLIVGIMLEIINHHVEAIRGLIFFIVAVILLIPGLYAVTHIYLAAKRVGKITFSTIPFFRR